MTNQFRMMLPPRQRAKLVNMHWNEISGVDSPANQEPGWLVMKAAANPYNPFEGAGADPSGTGAEELAEELWETDFSKCGPDIQEAASLLSSWLRQQGYDGQSQENSEPPDESLEADLKNTDFGMAPPNVRNAAAALGAYLAGDEEDERGSVPDTFPPVGVQLYGGTQRRDSQDMALRPGGGSQGFSGALATDMYQGRTRRARTMRVRKSAPTYRELFDMLQKDFYGPDFGNQPYQGSGGSLFSPNGGNSPRGAGGFSSGGPSGSFYRNEDNASPYTPTGNNGVSDGELASGMGRAADLSRAADGEALDAAYDQFLAANWPAFAQKAASIIANYSARISGPYAGGGDDITKAKGKNPFAKKTDDDDDDDDDDAKVKVKKELRAAVTELAKSVEANMEAFVEIAKRDFR